MRMRAILATIRHPANLFAELEQWPAAANNVVRSARIAFWRKGDKNFWCRGGPVG